jgi:alkanesulfonate monooxygenase SsuD/methylene tetrahydromethanopterin reductase-like flavin-dependent oxidoreductase (luciferase family)
VRFGIQVDFRNPPEFGRRDSEIYAGTLDNVSHAESVGFDDVWLSEHHFAADGYCPSPLVAGAAIAARTRRLVIGQSVLLLPLHNPLRIAEDGAVVDLISGGRFLLGVGLGYRDVEFQVLGVDRKHRAGILEEAVAVIKQAWMEPQVRFHGRHFDYDGVPVRPQPHQKPRPEIWVGGLTQPAVHRAARIADGLIAGGRRAFKWYVEGLGAAGRDATRPRVAGLPLYQFVDDDPERLRHQLAPHLLSFHNTVVRWFHEAGQAMPTGDREAQTIDDLAQDGRYAFTTPEDCARQIVEYVADVPLERYYILASLPGLDPAVAARWIDTFGRRVVPEVRRLMAAS